MTAAAACGIACLVFAWVAPAFAQTTIDADLTIASPYVFRGEVVTTLPTLQPRTWITTGNRAARLSAGAWSLVELRSPRVNDFSLRGSGGSAFGEWHIWAEVARERMGHPLTLGAPRASSG